MENAFELFLVSQTVILKHNPKGSLCKGLLRVLKNKNIDMSNFCNFYEVFISDPVIYTDIPQTELRLIVNDFFYAVLGIKPSHIHLENTKWFSTQVVTYLHFVIHTLHLIQTHKVPFV